LEEVVNCTSVLAIYQQLPIASHAIAKYNESYNESSAMVKNEAAILLHALSSNDASKHDTCDMKNTLAESIFLPLVYACKSCVYFFLLSKIYYICLAFQQCKLQFSQKISGTDKECRQFHIRDVDFTSHLTCRVTAYFTRVHVRSP